MHDREEVISIDQPAAWAAALEGLPHGFHHTWAACSAAQLNTGRPTYLYCAELGGTRVVCPFAERMRLGALDLVTPGGISGFAATGPAPGFAARWRDFALRRGAVCGYFAQHPEFADPMHGGEPWPTTPIYLLDLADGAAALMARANKDRRREWRLWEREGNRYVIERRPVVEFVLAQHAAFMHAASAAPASTYCLEALERLVSAPGALLVGAASPSGTLEAAALFGTTRWGAEGVLQVRTAQGRRHTVALMAWGIEALAARGVAWLNLGGGARPGDSIAAAKLKWRPRVGAFRRVEQVYRPDEYARLCALAGVDPRSRAGYFPAYYGAGPGATAVPPPA